MIQIPTPPIVEEKYFIGQPVWAKYDAYPWWPGVMHRNAFIEAEVKPGDYFVLFVIRDTIVNVAPTNLCLLETFSLEHVLDNLSQEFRALYGADIMRDYEKVKSMKASTEEAPHYSLYEGSISKKRPKDDEEINLDEDFAIEIKRTKFVGDEYQSLAEEYLSGIFRSKGIPGILELFGLTFSSLEYKFDESDIDEGTFGHYIYEKNGRIPNALKHLRNFLTGYCIIWSDEYKISKIDENFKHLFQEEFKKFKQFEKNSLKSLKEQKGNHLILGNTSFVQALINLKKIMDSSKKICEMSYQEHLAMMFKLSCSALIGKEGNVFFLSGEKLESGSLKLSLKMMNKLWIPNKLRMHPDLALIRTFGDFTHYFIIGEIDPAKLDAKNEHEFLAQHKDTHKIILEGRAVMKDAVTYLIKNKVDDGVKYNLQLKLYLFDSSGKVVILKMMPKFPELEVIEGETVSKKYGLCYDFVCSPLYSLFNSDECMIVLNELNSSITNALEIDYFKNDSCSIKEILATPITKKSRAYGHESSKIPSTYRRPYTVFYPLSQSVPLTLMDQIRLEEFMGTLGLKRSTRLEDKTTWNSIDELADAFESTSFRNNLIVFKNEISFTFTRMTESEVESTDTNVLSHIEGGSFLCEKYSRKQTRRVLFGESNRDYFNGSNNEPGNQDPPSDTDISKNSSVMSNTKPNETLPTSEKHSSNQSTMKDQLEAFKKFGVTAVMSSVQSELTFYRSNVMHFVCYCDCLENDGLKYFCKINFGTVIENHQVVERFMEIIRYSPLNSSFPYTLFVNPTQNLPDSSQTYITISERLVAWQETNLFKNLKITTNSKYRYYLILYLIENYCSGMYTLHKQFSIAHCDIGPRNVMFRNSCQRVPSTILHEKLRTLSIHELVEDLVVIDFNNAYFISDADDIEKDYLSLIGMINYFLSDIFEIKLLDKTDEELIRTIDSTLSIWGNKAQDLEEKKIVNWVSDLVKGINKHEIVISKDTKPEIIEYMDSTLLKMKEYYPLKDVSSINYY